jgi:hypothetical protein
VGKFGLQQPNPEKVGRRASRVDAAAKRGISLRRFRRVAGLVPLPYNGRKPPLPRPFHLPWTAAMKLPVSRWLLLVGIVLGTTPGGRAAAAPSDAELLAGADTRIEKHRKADAAIVVVNAAGRPLSHAKIDVEQTRHAFLFGCNIFLWGSLPNETTEQARSATRIVPRPGLPDSPPGEKLEQAYRRPRFPFTGRATNANGASPTTSGSNGSPAGASNTASEPRGIRWLGTVPMLRGFPAIRTSCTGCNWAASTIVCNGSPG